MKFMFNVFGKIIFGLSIISILALLCIQFLSYSNNAIVYTSNKNDSILFNKTIENKKGHIVLENMTPEYKEVKVLLNGDCIGGFSSNNQISFSVYNNDIIEVDTTEYKNHIIIKVIDASDNIILPKLNTILKISESIGFLSKIQLK